VQDVTLLLNDQLQQQFAERCGSRPSRMLFHGTKTQHFASIFEQGFIFKAQTDSGYFGQGYYFSSFPEYALSYSHQSCSANKPVHLIASYVCLGKSYEVKDMSFQGNPQLKPGYDSHYVRVVGPHFYPLAMNPEYKGSYPVYDEYVVTETWRVLPRFVITLRPVPKTFIWRDPKVYNEENQAIYAALKVKLDANIYLATSTEQVMQMVETKLKGKECVPYIITNGADDGKGLVEKLRVDIALEHPILVFCMNTTLHSQWAAPYTDVTVTGDSAAVTEWFQHQINNTSTQ